MLVKNETKRDYVIVLIAGGLTLIAASAFAAHRLAAVETMVDRAKRDAAALASQINYSDAIPAVCRDGYGSTFESSQDLNAVEAAGKRLESLKDSCENIVDTVEQVGAVERLLIYSNITATFDFLARETASYQAPHSDTSERYTGLTDTIPPIHLGRGEQHLADAK